VSQGFYHTYLASLVNFLQILAPPFINIGPSTVSSWVTQELTGSLMQTSTRNPVAKGAKEGILETFLFFLLFATGSHTSYQVQRQEDNIPTRISNASDSYRKGLTDTQAIR